MTTTLLKTKLYIPPARPALISRPRLIERLEEGLHLDFKLTLVCAPAGFGKTTLLSEWITGSGGRGQFAWISLDEGDNDVIRFWSYIITALQALEHGIGQAAMEVLQAAQVQPSSLEPLLISLVNDVTAYIEDERPFILILDDYHTLTTISIHESLDYLLNHLPPNLRIVIASREDPPLALPLLRGRGQLNEIRAADLRFTLEETTEFLNASMGLQLSPGDIKALEERTEGWVTGLQMAALSLQGQTGADSHNFVSAFTGDNRYIADYLLDQILYHQPPHIQHFLLRTSILNRVCGSLCEAVMGNIQVSENANTIGPIRDSQKVLEYLERNGLFLLPLDNHRHWYRYHRLFADLLCNHLQAVGEREKPGIAEIHQRASTWFEREGLIAEAVDHALSIPDYIRAANLIEKNYKETLWLGEFGLMFRWLEALPKELVWTRPALCLFYSILTMSHDTEIAEVWLQAAEKAWEAQSEPLDSSISPPSSYDREVFEANVADVRTILADLNGLPAEELITITLQSLEKTPEKVPSLRASMLHRLGWYHLTLGKKSDAERYFMRSKKLAETAGHYGNYIGATIGQAVIAWEHGRLHEAVAVCCETLQPVVEPLERSDRRLPVAGNLYIILGRLLLELYELDEAESKLLKGVELAELTSPMRSSDLLDGYYALACLRCIEGDFEGAFAWMERAQAKCIWFQEGVRALRVRIWLWRAQVLNDPQYLNLALAWARERDLENPARNEWELQSLAQATIAGYRLYGEPDLLPLLHVLGEQLRMAEAAGRDDMIIYMRILEALACQALGQLEQSMNSLGKALTLATMHGFIMSFVSHGAPMEALLRETLKRGISTAYVNQLLEAFSKGTLRLFSAETRPSQTSLPEPLSKREVEVLRLLASSLSGPQIADELFISLGTFQSHTKSIYGKLGVHNRFEAIERARDLKLV